MVMAFNDCETVFRLLQLVSTDDVNADPTNVLQLRQMQQKMANRLVTAKDWLKDPNAPTGLFTVAFGIELYFRNGTILM